MDRLDARILDQLQRDARLTIGEIAETVGLSLSACHRRIKIMEQSGLIEGYNARLNRGKLGLALDVFVEISLSSQSQDSLNAFEKAVNIAEEIRECHLTAGSADYILRVLARDMEEYEGIHRRVLANLPGVSAMRSVFTLKSIKRWEGLPVPKQ